MKARAQESQSPPTDSLLENISSRPVIRPTIRRLGEITEALPVVDILQQEQRAAIVVAARRKAEVRKVEFSAALESALMSDVYRAFDSFYSDWRALMSTDAERAVGCIESIDMALAGLLDDKEHGFQWLQDSLYGYADEDSADPGEFFDSDGLPREVHHLWLARQYLVAKHEALYETVDASYDDELTPKVFTSSRMESDIQQLIGDLCEAWMEIDPDVGLPDASNDPDNPLLRYLDACLAAVLEEKRPTKKSVLNFVKTQWKPGHWRRFDEPPLPFDDEEDLDDELPF